MTPTDLIAELAARGVGMTPDGDDLRIDAPTGVVTAAELDPIQEHKAEFLAILRADDSWESGVELIECSQCGAIDCWWNALGLRRCAACDPPPNTAQRYLETLARMQREGKCRTADAAANVGGLIGCGFPPVPVTEPPPEIIADPIVHCIACHDGRVLPGLPWTSKQLCYDCYARLHRPGRPQRAIGGAT